MIMRLGICCSCKEKLNLVARGLCNKCYVKQKRKEGYTQPLVLCKDCKKLKIHRAKGLCRVCYNKTLEKPIRLCSKCGKLKKYHAKGMCKSCYSVYGRPKIKCKTCGEKKLSWLNNQCKSCYEKKYRKNNPLKVKARSKIRTEVKSGRIPHPYDCICAVCKNLAKEYHHHKGYEEPYWLDVIPVCLKCHKVIE